MTTYSARHKLLGRTVAVQAVSVPDEIGLRDSLIQSFLRDARSASNLDHPNLLKIHDAEVEKVDGVMMPYLVSDFPAGRTLREQLKRYGPMERPRAVRLFVGCLEGLAEAHAIGLVNRGLKPPAMRLFRPGTLEESLHIIDFGTSHIEEQLIAQLSAVGKLRRRPPHLPPEYKIGGEASPTMDVYQMGLVLIEMLTGEAPLSGQDEIDRLRNSIGGGDVTLSQALHLGELGAILEKALAPDPSLRYPDAGSFAESLRRLEGESKDIEPKAPTSPARRGELNIGTILAGVYEISKEIGRGGFAVVYEGVQHGIERPVAIKVLTDNPKRSNRQEYEARFLREAKAAAQIDHNNVVTIYHFGLVERTRQPYMVMERLMGYDLEEELLENGPMTADRAVKLLCETLDALGEAHRLGIVHKDLKPSNLFLTKDRRGRELMKITDFGIALMGESHERLTLNGRPVCTPTYAAPEYVLELVVKPALDVYQMGLVLVEMITGEPVVDEDTVMKCIRRHLSGKLDIPEALMESVLGPVLRKALATSWRDRYPDADAFLDALSAVDTAQLKDFRLA